MSVLVSIGLAESAFCGPIPQHKSTQNDVAVIVDSSHVEFDHELPHHRSKTCPRTCYVGRFICEVSHHGTAEVTRLVVMFWGQNDALLD